jgi:ADP-dependent NAD(P)H-hydrate dehydratase / NAD(P)H-hydrate epimerase
MPVRVVSAAESAERDRAAIESGTPSRTLMQRAGRGAASEIVRRFAERLHDGVIVFTGPGNNGGDGWVVAGQLAGAGVPVTVVEAGAARTPDAMAERAAAVNAVTLAPESDADGGARVVVDALLGTGFRGAPHGEVQASIARVNALRQSGVSVASLDLPSGLDATTGARTDCVRADVTLSFGGIKRGTLLARDCCGEIVVIDIGLEGASQARDESLPILIDRPWVESRLPRLGYDSHKGARKHLAIVGGGRGMAGAPILASRGALRSGIGIVRAVVSSENTDAVTAATPAALVLAWPTSAEDVETSIESWADGIVIGPGMGKSPEARNIFELLLRNTGHPVVIDADALNLFEGDLPALRDHLRGRKSVITPHVAEFARLARTDVKTVLAERFDIGRALASDLGATVLLKGTPSIIFAPDGERLVSARGTAALGTGGSGDVLAGIVGTLLAQTEDPTIAAGCAAWIHGRAAELCDYVRGTTLDDVLYALPRAWNEAELPAKSPVLARLPAVSA